MIRVPWDVHRTSPNQRLSWQEKRRRTKVAKQIATLIYRQEGCPSVVERATVTYIARRATTMDDDNVIGGAKPIRDALFCRRRNGVGITEDDSAEFLQIEGVRQEIDRRYKGQEQLLVCVRSRQEPP